MSTSPLNSSLKIAENSSNQNAYTNQEEFFNTLTHALGLVVALIGAVVLICNTYGNGVFTNIVGGIIYSLSLIMLYLSSTLYHGVKNPHKKKKLKMLDHLSIYLLILGSYTPFCLTLLPAPTGKITLLVVFLLSLLGISYEIFFIGKSKLVSSLLYMIAAYPAFVIIKIIWITASYPLFFCLFLGGVIYSLGVIFYVNKKIPGNHAIWHLFVLVASMSHYAAIYLLLTTVKK